MGELFAFKRAGPLSAAIIRGIVLLGAWKARGTVLLKARRAIEAAIVFIVLLEARGPIRAAIRVRGPFLEARGPIEAAIVFSILLEA
jgi:hypothetical protein